MGVSQVNLSTETRPPKSTSALALTADPPNVINSPNEFLRLLWEASITRSGGFFLTFATGIGSGTLRGLPDRIFNDSNTASVAVLSLFRASTGEGQSITNYTNVLATNQPFDLSDAALVAIGVPVQTTSIPTAADTLAALANRYYTDASLIAKSNPDAVLAGTVRVTGGMYEVPANGVAPGGKLADIAAYFATTETGIKEANANRTHWPAVLPQYTRLALPPVDVRTGIDPGGKTFATLSAYYNAPVANIAAANLLRAGVIASGTTLELLTGPINVAPQIQPGVAGFHAWRIAPEIPITPVEGWGEAYLLQIFNLLGYRAAGNSDCRQSFWGLPGGPVDPSGNIPEDKITAMEAPAAGDRWDYTRSVPYPKLYEHAPQVLNASLPAPVDSPYLGAGHVLQFELMWQDLFGNAILSELSEPQNASNQPLNQAPQIPGYTDRLIPPGQWPAVANAFLIKAGNDQKPVLELHLSFDESPYTARDGKDRAERALVIYSQIIWQITDPNGVAISLTTTVTPDAGSILSDVDKEVLTAWINNIYLWLRSLITPGDPHPLDPNLVIAVPLDRTKLNKDQIFEVAATLTVSRNPALVAGDLSTVPSITSASTALAPWTGKLTAESPEEQREISVFAKAFTDAFLTIPGVSYHIATGSSRNAFSSSGKGGLWAVQLGDVVQSTAISYKVADEGALIYAPRPISNKLKSKPTTPIIPYRTGSVISLLDKASDTAFNNVDQDQWLSFATTNIDALLTTRYVAPAAILRKKTGVDTMQSVLNAKKALAGALKNALIPVFKNVSATEPQKKAIQEAFYQTMLGQVSQFYAVKAGIQFDTQVNSALPKHPGETDPPRLYGEIADVGSAAASNRNISLSSPKLNLRFAGQDGFDHYLSFLLSSTSNSATVSLDLTLQVSNIEHEIGKLAGIEGYQPSSWLSFADNTRDAKWPLNANLGMFDVPIVLRAFPETPTLVRQEVQIEVDSPCYKAVSNITAAKRLFAPVTCEKTGTYNPLAGVTLWNYGFEYSQRAHFLQDEVHGEIQFNTHETGIVSALAAPPRDLFDNLAEFVQVYPLVRADLDSYLAPLDLDTTDQKQIDNASAALQSAANLIQWIADTANVFEPPRAALFSAQAAPYSFTIRETETNKINTVTNTTVEALAITIDLPSAPPLGTGNPLVLVEPELYDCETDGEDASYRRFVYKNKKTGLYLTSEEGLRIPGRGFILPNLGVLERQSAQAAVYLSRNRVLAEKQIADVFVYTTPEVSFPDPLLPTLTVDQDVDLATIFAKNKTNPVSRSLDCQLSCLYDVLFETAGTETVTLAMTAYYEYSVSDSLPPVRLPVFLMPPMLTAILSGNSGAAPLSDVVARQASGFWNWFNSMKPQTTKARLFFELTIMSNLTARPMPVLKLTGLNVAYSNVQPPV